MPPVKLRRRYRSPLRDESVLRGRKAVIAAAAELFTEQGYAATTIDHIAARARVSRPTVFAVGTKARLLALARLDAIAGDDAYGNDRVFQEILAIPDPSELLRRFAQFTADIARRLGPLHAVLEQAAPTDAELETLLRDSQQELHACARKIIAALATAGALRADLRPAHATDVLWLLIHPSQYQRLVAERRWSHRAFEQWQASSFIALLTADSAS